MTTKKFQVNDRVRRVQGGCAGIVKEIREEVTSSSGDSREKALLVNVFWDNGTLSYFSPESLQLWDQKSGA